MSRYAWFDHQEIREECVRRLKLGLRVAIVLPWTASSRRTRLFRQVGPYGEVACVNSDGHTVAYFDPARVLQALDCDLHASNW